MVLDDMIELARTLVVFIIAVVVDNVNNDDDFIIAVVIAPPLLVKTSIFINLTIWGQHFVITNFIENHSIG